MNLPITELKVTVDDKPLDPDNQREYLNSIQNKKQMELRLLEKRKPEEFWEFSKFY